jgi:hypothetical protein
MRRTLLRAVFALSALASCSLGCGSNTSSSANSFTKVYEEVIQPQCANDFCHYNGASIRYSALDLSSKVRAYWSLVDLPCMGPACSQSGMRVAPWQPDHSIFYLKLLPSPPCGIQMPADSTGFYTNGTSDLKFSGKALSTDAQQLIYNWILEGAPYN